MKMNIMALAFPFVFTVLQNSLLSYKLCNVKFIGKMKKQTNLVGLVQCISFR